MVGSTSPHAYSRNLSERGGSEELLRVIRGIDASCIAAGVAPVYTLNHLAIIAHCPHKVLRDIIFQNNKFYQIKRLVKKSGGTRIIHLPSAYLKSVQRAILDACLPSAPSSSISFAFEKGRGTLQAASSHIGARSMISVDIHDFFGSIRSNDLFAIFSEFGYSELLSLEMALLSSAGHIVAPLEEGARGKPYVISKGGYLPQGASPSGKLSNLACRGLDRKLLQIAHRCGGSITRYADDISLSLPSTLSKRAASDLLSQIRSAIEGEGFKLNDKKTRVVRSSYEFRALGLIVGQENVWLNPKYKQLVRNHLYGLKKFGLSNHANLQGKNDLEMIEFIWGHYAYGVSVDPEFGAEVAAALHAAGVNRV